MDGSNYFCSDNLEKKNGERTTKGRVHNILRFTGTLNDLRKFILADLNRMLHFKWLKGLQRMALDKTKAFQSLTKNSY